jgi:molybdopterin molybdotransferase
VGLRFFVVPALRRLQGLDEETYLTARLKTEVRKKRDLRFFGKAIASSDSNGQLEVELLPGQESFKISPLMTANSWLVAEEGQDSLAAGDRVHIAPLYPGGF